MANAAAWGWAMAAFAGRHDLLAAALLAWTLGLRHAFDADHIAAIDNSVRKLIAAGRAPIGAGFFFSLGHSTVVVLASAAVALVAGPRLQRWHEVGGAIGTLVSAGFLLAIALANLVVLRGSIVAYRRAKRGEPGPTDALDGLLGGGPFARWLRPLFGIIARSWHLYPLGLLFGLGFDTATEVALIGIAATQSAQGSSLATVMVFPALFTAGMSLLDTVDSVVMTGAYGWALVDPLRKLRYNLAVTALSVAAALGIGGIELLSVLGDRFALSGSFWAAVARVGDHFAAIGAAIVGLFVLGWIAASTIYLVRTRAARA